MDGFKMNFITSSARVGWEYAREYTDNLKLKSVAQPDGKDKSAYNSWGELLTDGTRVPEMAPGVQPYQANRIMQALSMVPEGSGQHWYSENGPMGRFINQVSKVHDAFNSWNYNSETGRYISRGQAFDTAFDTLWSFPGMPIAGAYTAVSMSTNFNPYLNATIGR